MEDILADPERALALSYAPAKSAGYLRTLWMVDERFGSIVAGTTEATIGEMRLLWWREALAGQDADLRRAEPLLEKVAETLAATGASGAEWGRMAEGWFALLQEPLEPADLRRFADERGGRLFALSATLLAAETPGFVVESGRAWALADLACRVTDPDIAAAARAMASGIFAETGTPAWPRALRPLGALAMLARRDAAADGRRQGSPARVARMVWHRLTGR
jgi:phytoene synthase